MNVNTMLCAFGVMVFCLLAGCVSEKSCHDDIADDILYEDFCSHLYAGSVTKYEELKWWGDKYGFPETLDSLLLDARISSLLKVEILGSPKVLVAQPVLKKLVKTDKSEEVRIAAVRKIEDREFVSKIAADKTMGNLSTVAASLIKK